MRIPPVPEGDGFPTHIRMNFLAHFFLSHQTPELIVGSYLGDFVKGKQYQHYDLAVGQGILLHREIDRYTDAHPIFRQSKHRLSQQHGHYAGVIVDIFYDHLLATQWSAYSEMPLPDFAAYIYTVLQQYIRQMPASAQRVSGYMQAHNWLANYAHSEGVTRTLSGMQQRAHFPNRMGQALDDFARHEYFYAQEFQAFFPQIQQHVTNFLAGTDELPGAAPQRS